VLGTPNPTLLTNYFTPLVPGWSEVTVISNEAYNVNGYNFTYNKPENTSSHFGLPYYISFTSPNSITVTFYTFKEQSCLISLTSVTVKEPYINKEYNTTQKTLTLQNGYYLLIANYERISLKYYFYLDINIPLWGLVNGTEMVVKSGYYHNGTVINLFVNFSYVNNFERYMLLPNITHFVMTKNVTVYVAKVLQYYLQVTSEYPVTAYINGVKENLSTNWYNYSEKIVIHSQTYYVDSQQREVLLNPIITTITQAINYTARWQTQYYVFVSFPINASVNGKYEVINSSWYNASTVIIINQNPQYIGEFERFTFILSCL